MHCACQRVKITSPAKKTIVKTSHGNNLSGVAEPANGQATRWKAGGASEARSEAQRRPEEEWVLPSAFFRHRCDVNPLLPPPIVYSPVLCLRIIPAEEHLRNKVNKGDGRKDRRRPAPAPRKVEGANGVRDNQSYLQCTYPNLTPAGTLKQPRLHLAPSGSSHYGQTSKNLHFNSFTRSRRALLLFLFLTSYPRGALSSRRFS